MTTYGYVRVSTRDQAEAFGADVQMRAVAAHGVLRSGEVYKDLGVSGTLLNRRGLGDLLNRLTEGDVVVVPRLDRLARSLVIQELLLAQIHEAGARVISCVEGENTYLAEDVDDPSLKLIRHVLGAIAEYEREMIAQRTQAGKRAKKAAGGYAGGQPPYGWRGEGGNLHTVNEEQTVIREIHKLADKGYGFAEIATALNDGIWIGELSNGVGPGTLYSRRRNGKPWTAGAVRKILLRQGTPAGAVGQDGVPVDSRQVDDQVAVLDGDGGKDVRADRGGPLGL